MSDDDAMVTYPVKELLERMNHDIKQGFADQRAESKKATDKLFELHRALAGRVDDIDTWRKQEQARKGKTTRTFKELIGIAYPFAAAISAIVGIVLTVIHR